jgi:hypothetical protein
MLQVVPYDDDTWKKVARDVVTKGCYLKFSQNAPLRLIYH